MDHEDATCPGCGAPIHRDRTGEWICRFCRRHESPGSAPPVPAGFLGRDDVERRRERLLAEIFRLSGLKEAARTTECHVFPSLGRRLVPYAGITAVVLGVLGAYGSAVLVFWSVLLAATALIVLLFRQYASSAGRRGRRVSPEPTLDAEIDRLQAELDALDRRASSI